MIRFLLVLSLYLFITNARYFQSWKPIANITDLNGNAFTSSTKTGAVGRFFGITNNRTTIQTFGTGLNGDVYALCFGATYETVYVGGDFTDANGVSVTSIVQLNTTNGQWIALSGSYTGVAKALVFSPTRNILVAGGTFVIGIQCSAMIWNGTWQASPNSLTAINALVLYAGDIIVGGGNPASNIIQDQGNGIWSDTALNDNGTVNAFTIDSTTGTLFVGTTNSVISMGSPDSVDLTTQKPYWTYSMLFTNDLYLPNTLVMVGENEPVIFACSIGNCNGKSSTSNLSSGWLDNGKKIYTAAIDSNSHDLIVGGAFFSIGNVPITNFGIVSLLPPKKDDRPVCVIGSGYLPVMQDVVSSIQEGFNSVRYIEFTNVSKSSDFDGCYGAIVLNDGAPFTQDFTAFGNALLTKIQQGMGVIVTETCLRFDLPCFGNSTFVDDSLCTAIAFGPYAAPNFHLLDSSSPVFSATELFVNDILAYNIYIPRNDSEHIAAIGSDFSVAMACVRKIPNLIGGNTKVLVLNMHPYLPYTSVGSSSTLMISSLKDVSLTLNRPCPPYQCPDGTCVNNLADCYSPPSIDYSCFNTPKKYYCSQTSQCESSLSVCSAASLNQTCSGYTCWNGACKSNSSQCDVVPSCSPFEYRCRDGSCNSSLSGCPTVSNCSLSSKPYRCPDGVCAANVSQCAPFDGCTVGMVLCASGICAQNSSSCYAPNSSRVICQDGTTANSISECVPYVGVYDVPPISANYPSVSSSVYMTLSMNSFGPSALTASLNASSSTFQTNNPTTCNLTISMSILPNSVFDLKNLKYNEGNTGFLFTPNSFGMEISIPSCVQVTKPAQISFRVSRNFNITNKCLAYLDRTQNKWKCLSTVSLSQITTESGTDYYVIGTTPHFSSFAVVGIYTNELPTVASVDSSSIGGNNSSIGLIVGIVVAAVVLLVVVIIVIIVVLKRRKLSSTKKEADEEKILMTTIDNKISDRSFAKGDIKKGEKIGGGRFGSVFKGDYQSTPVALKSLIESNAAEFEREASTLRKLRHPNIVWYFGIWNDEQEEKYIVTEFISGGSLKDLLVKDNSLTQANFISFSLDIANGMSYLHSQKILHRDLAARNVLVLRENDKWIAKVSDFGLAAPDVETSSEMQAVRWTAPETLTSSKFSFASDVFSFSITMYEIFSRGLLPYSDFKTLEVFEKVPKGLRMDRVVNSDITIPEKIFELIERCWAQEPISRPIFEEICKVLTSFNENPKSIHDKVEKTDENGLGKEFMLDKNDIVKGKSIGSGQFGQVYLGTWASQQVALKTVSNNQDSKTAFIQEIKLAIQLHSPAVVNTFGAVEMGGSLYVVMEFCEKGSLLDWLKSNEGSAASQMTLVKMALQTTRALVILEKRSIIHRDIAARNFLLTGDLSVKLADFGLARWSAKGDLYNAKSDVMIPIRWAAPEIILRNQYSAASDRFALGVTLWEIFATGGTPHVALSNSEICKKWESKSMDSLRQLDLAGIDEVIAKLCSYNPQDRPTLDFVERFFSDQLPKSNTQTTTKVDDYMSPVTETPEYKFSPYRVAPGEETTS